MVDYRITFGSSLKKEVLNAFGKDINRDNVIVEKDNPEQIVPAFDGGELTLDDFGGIKKGSELFIRRNFVSLMELVGEGKA